MGNLGVVCRYRWGEAGGAICAELSKQQELGGSGGAGELGLVSDVGYYSRFWQRRCTGLLHLSRIICRKEGRKEG